jgi:hypothetical protein
VSSVGRSVAGRSRAGFLTFGVLTSEDKPGARRRRTAQRGHARLARAATRSPVPKHCKASCSPTLFGRQLPITVVRNGALVDVIATPVELTTEPSDH